MKSFNRIFTVVIALIVLVVIGANVYLFNIDSSEMDRPYRVEISRLALEIKQNGIENTDLSECKYVTGITEYSENFYSCESDYVVREINGKLYRFDYEISENNSSSIVIVNVFLAIMAVMIIKVMIYIKSSIILPFDRLKDVPYELSKGNLTVPIWENESRFFGRFIWGVDLLRENIEQQKKRELELQKEKKTVLLSLSHDIKTPLSAIKLYAKALSKGLYTDKAKQLEIAENINAKANEIEGFVSQIISASREDFLILEVNSGEFYLGELVRNVEKYYSEKLSIVKTEFTVSEYNDCFIKGDLDRGIEVLQNIIENSVKYGNGKMIAVDFFEEDNCILVSVKNSGCTLKESELPHIFESFWRGSNSEKTDGSGLGLYICRQLMRKMGGEVFAKIEEDIVTVSAVFAKV